jgi:hypothetical protein
VPDEKFTGVAVPLVFRLTVSRLPLIVSVVSSVVVWSAP